MKLQELKSRCLQGHPKLSVAFSVSGMVIAAIVLAIVIAALTDGPFNAQWSRALAAPEQSPDELQIQLDGNGFTPGEVQHAAGTFAIAVENANLEGEYTLKLKATDGTVLKEVQVQKGSSAWTVTLSPGDYTLTEASHPQWLCRIVVT